MMIIQCTYCGKDAQKRPYEVRSGMRLFCSRKCMYSFIHEAKVNTGENSATWKGGEIVMTCVFCNKEFKAPRCQNAKYCSKSCSDKARMTRKYFNCKECGKEYWRLPCQLRQHGITSFCSLECEGIWSSKYLRGDKAPGWKGGKGKRPSDSELANHENYKMRQRLIENCVVNDFIKADWQEILQTFNYRCAYCHKESNRMEKDHIIPLSRGGNHTKSNIIPACRSCNSRKHNKTLLEYVQYLGG